MPGHVIVENVDIYQCPILDIAHIANAGDELTSGDLHGNAIKLLFLLVKYGIAKNMTEVSYNRCVEIYKRSFEAEGLSADDLVKFDELLHSIEFNSEATIRLLGDILADRGGNDYLTLLILSRLRQCHVKYEIILSNHDLEFLINFQNPRSDFSRTKILGKGPYCRSMLELGSLIDGGFDRTVIDGMVTKAYLPSLKLLSYAVNDQRTGITLFSHAPIGLANIEQLARRFKVKCQIASLPELVHTIDAVNRSFVNYVARGGKISRLVNHHKLCDPEQDPVGHALWNRDTESLERPAKYMDYKIHYAHGHHGDEGRLFPMHIINLDNDLGKAYYTDKNNLQHHNKGEHTLLYSGWAVGLHKNKSHPTAASANLEGQRSPNELGQWLMVDFPGILMAMDQTGDDVKHHFLKSVRVLGFDAANLLLRDKNYKAASSIAKLCEDLLHGYEQYVNDRDELKFQQVCRHVFATLKPQINKPVFLKRTASFVALAKAIEEMGIGLCEKDIYSPHVVTLSDKPAALFSGTSDSEQAQSPSSLDTDLDLTSISSSKSNDSKV